MNIRRKNIPGWIYTAIALLLWLFIVLIFGGLDIAYAGRPSLVLVENLVDLIVQKGRSLGLSYSRAYNLLSSNFGTGLTVVGIILTLSVNISNRSELRVYGLIRSDLDIGNKEPVYQIALRMAMLSPLFLIYSINAQLCLTGYIALVLPYVFFIYTYLLYSNSYRAEENRKKVIRKLSNVLDEYGYLTAESSVQWRTLMEDLKNAVRKEGYYANVQLLYETLIEETFRWDDSDKGFLLTHLFFDSVFMGETDIVPALMTFESFVFQMDDIISNPKTTIKSEKVYTVFWAILCSLFWRCDEAQLQQFLEILFNYEYRIVRLLKHTNGVKELYKKKFYEKLHIQTGLLLIGMELWLTRNDIKQSIMLQYLESGWIDARKALCEEYNILTPYFIMCNTCRKEENCKLEAAAKALQSDYMYSKGLSIIYKILQE